MKENRKISWEKPIGIAITLIFGALYLCDRVGLIDAKKFILLMILLLAVDIFAWISEQGKLKKDEKYTVH